VPPRNGAPDEPLDADTAVAVRRAVAAIALTRGELIDAYNARRQPSRANPPRSRCDEAAGDDCFGGDYECRLINACAWGPARDEMVRIADGYDNLAALVNPVARHIDAELLRWFEGQRVGGWARLRELGRARAALDDCLSSAWWCTALGAFVDHLDGRYADAERGFRSALTAMPPTRACYWNEITLLGDSLARSGRHGGPRPCRTLAELETFWLLADPLFTQPGNDRLSAHYARHVDMTIHDDFLAVFGGSHTMHHHSEVLRLGWPTGFRVLPKLQDAALHTVLVHDGGQGFVVFDEPADALRLPADRLAPRDGDRREQYRTAYGRIEPLPAQHGFFRRNDRDGLLIRAESPAAAVTAGGRGAGSSATAADTAGWQLVSWNGERWRRAAVAHPGGQLMAWLETPWEPQIYSLELLHAGGAFRARSGTRPPTSHGNAAVSSIVLVDVTDASGIVPGTLPTRMLPYTTVNAGTPVAAYWEVYVADRRNTAVELVTTRLEPPGRLARLLRRAAPAQRRVRWIEELQPADGVVSRTVALDLDGLAPGAWEVTLTLTLDDGSVLSTASFFRIDRR
jgi:hypothetical protein